MLHQNPETFGATFALTHPASQWTAAVKVRFLDCLAQRGNVRVACARVGLSAETAYRQRRRDPVFARAWAAATALARHASEQVLADRAIDGIEEPVWYRGEMVGTRQRYDTRLLLAHLGRLDKAVSEDPAAQADAERFDELLAVIAGEDPAGLAEPGDDPLPPDREALVREAVDEATRIVDQAWEGAGNAHGELEDDDYARYRAELDEAEAGARAETEARHDEWLARAHASVDALLDDAPARPSTAAYPAPLHAQDGSPAEPCQRRQHPGAGEPAADPVDCADQASSQPVAGAAQPRIWPAGG